MSETKNTKPGEKGVRDLTPTKDAKGGGHHGHQKHNQNLTGGSNPGQGPRRPPQPDDFHPSQP